MHISMKITEQSNLTGIIGLAGSAVDGHYTPRNGATVTNHSKESQMYDFGETCKSGLFKEHA